MNTINTQIGRRLTHLGFIVFSMVFCYSFNAGAQDIDSSRLHIIEPFLKAKRESVASQPRSTDATARTKSTLNEMHRLTGYIYETTHEDISYHHRQEVTLAYPTPSVMRYLNFYENDTTEVRSYEMDPDFDYNYLDLFSILDPGIPLWRSQDSPGNMRGRFLKMETKAKSGGKWVSSGKMQGRVQVPYGYEYAYSGSWDSYCSPGANGSWVFERSGEWKDNRWILTQDVIQRDCNSLTPIKIWKQVVKTDASGHKREDINYMKESGQFNLTDRHTYEYDDQGRVIGKVDEYTSPTVYLKNNKRSIRYDDRGNEIWTDYSWDGVGWQLYSRVLPERTTDGTYLYTTQYLINGVWQLGAGSRRETYSYDVRGRQTYFALEYWNDTSKQWDLRESTRQKFFKDDLVAETEWIDVEQYVPGFKSIASYDDQNRLVARQTFGCPTLSDCKQGNYVPAYRGRYGDVSNNRVDYISIQRYDSPSGRWVAFDSLATLYNEDNEIEEHFWQSYGGKYPETLSYRRHYIFNYGDFVVTGEKDIAPMSFFPNPAHTQISFNCRKEELDYLVITDMVGNEMNFDLKNSNEGSTEVSLAGFAPGIYIVRYSVNGKTFSQRLVKK